MNVFDKKKMAKIPQTAFSYSGLKPHGYALVYLLYLTVHKTHFTNHCVSYNVIMQMMRFLIEIWRIVIPGWRILYISRTGQV